jgi:c-di-GMP-binding flagellar brake protein YcgR
MELFNKVDIYDNEDNIVLSSNQVTYNEDRLTLFGDFNILLKHGERVNATGFSEDGFLVFNGVVTLSVQSQLNLADIQYGEKMDRRNFLKVKASFNGVLLMGYELVNGKKTLLTDEVVKVRDISIGGIGFYFKKPLIKRQKILIRLDDIKQGFTTEAIVLRKEKMKHDYYRYRYGCRFLDLDNVQQSILCKYVFKIQIERRRRINGAWDDGYEVDKETAEEAETEQ